MKKLIPFILLILLLASCDQNVDPKTPFKERYILTFLMRGDTTFQTATLTRSYDAEGIDPNTSRIDPSITDADIRLWYDGEVYQLRDTIIERKDTTRYTDLLHYYYLNLEAKQNTNLEVRVLLRNGKRLYAVTKTPATLLFDSLSFLIPHEDKRDIAFVWHTADEGVYYMPRLKIFYKLNEPGNVQRLSKEVPLAYRQSGNDSVPLYPKLSKNTFLNFENAALDSVMKQIGVGEVNKKNIVIYDAYLELLIFDNAVSAYISSTNGYLDEYSIRIDEKDYTNIQGGYGIFGSYIRQKYNLVLRQEYVLSFGYAYGFYP
ncbi:MAG: hypothetical protein NTX22_17030 [Ignavibacteriales bacterium]|nr:hypothetical protein [Ignavibacteriales bacterium]